MSEEEIIKEIVFMAKWFPKLNLIKERQTILGLLDLYNKEKRKNKCITKETIEFINSHYIHKDKIREKIKELYETKQYWNTEVVDILKELLEEE